MSIVKPYISKAIELREKNHSYKDIIRILSSDHPELEGMPVTTFKTQIFKAKKDVEIEQLKEEYEDSIERRFTIFILNSELNDYQKVKLLEALYGM